MKKGFRKILKILSFCDFPTQLTKLYLSINLYQLLNFHPESITHIKFVEQYKFNKPLQNLTYVLEYLN